MVSPLVRFQLKQHFTRPILFGLLGLFAFIIAVYANQFSYQFVQLQAGNTEGINLSSDVLAPLNSLSMLLCLLLSPLIAAQLHPRRVAHGIQRLVNSYPIAISQLWRSDWVCLFGFVLSCHLVLLIIHLPLIMGSSIDWPVYLMQLLAHLLTTLFFASIITALFNKVSNPLAAIVSSYGLLFVFWIIPILSQWPDYFFWLQPFNLFDHYRPLSLGLVALAPLGLLSLGIMILVLIHSIDWSQFSRFMRSVGLTGALILWLACSQLTKYWDVTSNQRYSLHPVLIEQLQQYADRISVISYGLDEAALDEVELRLLNSLRQHFPQLQYQKVEAPAQWEDRGQQGLMFEWQEQQIWIGYPFAAHPQQLLLKSLTTLNQRQRQWLLFTDGHQESKISKNNARSLSLLSKALQDRGFKLSQASLRELNAIPENTQLVIIASARQDWLVTEQQALMHYLQAGGNLFWLRDPEDHALGWLEDYLGVVKIPGTLIDPVGYDQGTPHPAVILIDQYEAHPLLQSLSSITALPWASGLSKTGNHWQVTPLLHTHDRVWTELQPEQDNLSYDENVGELKGRFPTLMVLQRQQGRKTQSVVISGDSHFLSDQAINNYDNRQLALNLFYWLTQTDVGKMPKLTQAIDRHLQLSPAVQHLLNWFNPFVLPVLLIATGVWLWHRQKNR